MRHDSSPATTTTRATFQTPAALARRAQARSQIILASASVHATSEANPEPAPRTRPKAAAFVPPFRSFSPHVVVLRRKSYHARPTGDSVSSEAEAEVMLTMSNAARSRNSFIAHAILEVVVAV